MKIGIVGSGNMGGGLGKIWVKAGHQVIFSYSRDENKLRQLAASAGENAKVGTPEEAVYEGDVVMLAVWVPSLEEVIRAAGSLDGKIIITCVSGLQPDFTGQTIGIATNLKTSVAETIQHFAPKAKVVEAFNITFAEIIGSDSRQFGGDRPSIFYCGDDAEAKKVVAGLIEECGYEAVDAGELLVARSLETLATAWVQFAVTSKLFPNLGLKALRR
ncbi:MULTISPECIES: NADPH-dependent F420 reductase [Nostoc]|uniref:NAD(P)-binding domain-containing protein n=1 Tax=Nostoc paludosum FACHB-159 TaxID=2692908 RepID=A0ABR8KFI6_9NOSO|nr:MULTISPECIES: NAD(P)-binding domain-containing protein [Nostoc]MBD2681947.1 NAD(P)-binding domain-containing protein [Nostoc sp. FACHB-857]MBD2738317.1 NAD(P)-binding domain-containing protein [Nostoc paludosum FACHB-159]